MVHGAPSHVTQDELRAALTAGASQRSPAWNWNAELTDPERTELDGLRGHVADLQAQTAQLRERADTATNPLAREWWFRRAAVAAASRDGRRVSHVL